MAHPPAGAERPSRRTDGRRANRALVGGLAALTVGAALLATRDWRPPAEPAGAVEPRMARGAWELCRRAATERLGLAAPVRFPWFDQRAVTRASDSVFVVRASVEAGGAGGAPVRAPVTCRARWLGADRWLDEGTVVQAP
jgi:hypothetical protein